MTDELRDVRANAPFLEGLTLRAQISRTTAVWIAYDRRHTLSEKRLSMMKRCVRERLRRV
jgi:hypothetical protein